MGNNSYQFSFFFEEVLAAFTKYKHPDMTNI